MTKIYRRLINDENIFYKQNKDDDQIRCGSINDRPFIMFE